MKNAQELLVDVRRWICDNLSNKDAGRLCNMLAYVSRHISAIEAESEILHCNYVDKIEYILALERKILCVDDENRELRDQVERQSKRQEAQGGESVLVEVAIPLECIGTVRCDFDGIYRVQVLGEEVDTDGVMLDVARTEVMGR